MERKSLIITANTTSFILDRHLKFLKAKVTKFRLIPDNLANLNCICLNINNISYNNIHTTNGNNASYFFMIPFINNNVVPFYSNDVYDTWDLKLGCERTMNRFDITITNETGQLLTFNNSHLIVEILFET